MQISGSYFRPEPSLEAHLAIGGRCGARLHPARWYSGTTTEMAAHSRNARAAFLHHWRRIRMWWRWKWWWGWRWREFRHHSGNLHHYRDGYFRRHPANRNGHPDGAVARFEAGNRRPCIIDAPLTDSARRANSPSSGRVTSYSSPKRFSVFPGSLLGLLTLIGRQRRERIFSRSRSKECDVLNVLKRRTTQRSGKSAPSLRVADKIGPYFVVSLDLGIAKAFGLRLVSHPTDEDLSVGTPVWPDFLAQRCRPIGVNRP